MVMLTEKVMNFLHTIKENGGKITKKDQNMYGSVAYYLMIQYLKKNGLVVHNGNTTTNQKIWKLSKKGSKVVDIIIELRGVLDGEGEGSGS